MYKPDKHLIPKKGDAVYVDGQWVMDPNSINHIWVKADRSRVNGTIIYVDYESQEVRIAWKDFLGADPDEPKITEMDFATLYGQWSSSKECYVVTVDQV